jgi:hypothetical protein
VLNSPPIIMTVGNGGPGLLANHTGGRYTNSSRCLKFEASGRIQTDTTDPRAGTLPARCIAAAVTTSVWSGSGPPVSSDHADPTVGTYPTQEFTVLATQAALTSTASADSTRCHHRLSRQPATTTATAPPTAPIHTQSLNGGGSPQIPADAMHQ